MKKIRIEMEVDMETGTYDVRFHNLSNPGEEIDLTRMTKIVSRVLENVAIKSTRPIPEPTQISRFKTEMN